MYSDERYSGVWNGREITIKREWRGHVLTDDECERLCDGEIIEIRDLVSSKTGKPYGVTARLALLTSKTTGKEYVGVDQVDFIHDKPDRAAYSGTSDRQEHPKRYDADKNEGFDRGKSGNYRRFSERRPAGVPDRFRGHKFTEDEKFMLESGMPVRVDFESVQSGKPYSRMVVYDPKTGELEIKFEN